MRESTETIYVRIPASWKERLQQIADQRTVSVSTAVRWAIQEYLDRIAPSGSDITDVPRPEPVIIGSE